MAEEFRVRIQKFKDRPALMLQWTDPDTGKRKSASAGTSDPEQAEEARLEKQIELRRGLHEDKKRLAWDRLRELFEAEYLAGLRERSREKYNCVLDVFETICNPTRVHAITERTVSAFVRGMRERKRPGGKVGLKTITIRNYLTALKTALQWASGQKLIGAVPDFPRIKAPKKRPQPIPTETFERLLEKAPDDKWKAFMLCGWWGGLRLSEASHLHWEHSDKYPWLDLTNDRIVLPAVFAKSDEDQWVPLHPTLKEAIEKVPQTGPRVFTFTSRKGGLLSRSGITNYVLRLAKLAGVKLSMHKLRKGFGCRVAKQLGKGNAPVLHSLMRHSSMQITMDYYASVDDALQDAMKTLK